MTTNQSTALVLVSARIVAESLAIALFAQAKEAARKGGNKAKEAAKELQEKANAHVAQADRHASNFADHYRGGQLAIAFVNAAVRTDTPLARRIADRARTYANSLAGDVSVKT